MYPNLWKTQSDATRLPRQGDVRGAEVLTCLVMLQKGRHGHNLAMILNAHPDKESQAEGYIRTRVDRKPVLAGEEEWEGVRRSEGVGGHGKTPHKRAKLPGWHPVSAIYLSYRQTKTTSKLHLFILRAAQNTKKNPNIFLCLWVFSSV